jgi:hypothetical protein
MALPAIALVLLLMIGPGVGPSVAASARAQPAVAPLVPAIFPLAASVTWNGQNISSASSVSGAFTSNKGDTAAVRFTFSGDDTANITNVTLEVTYLGIVLTTSRSTPHIVGGPPVTGSAVINWSFGSLYDALEGVFHLTASLVYANGSTAWSEGFYVFVKTPYLLESGAVVVLLILTAAELYWGISAIREARKGRKPAPTPGPTQPAEGTAGAPPGPASPPSAGPGTGEAGTTGGAGDTTPPTPPGGSS